MVEFFENLGEVISGKAKEVGKKTEEVMDVVAKNTGEVVDVVAKKTEQTVEVQKIKCQIRTMEKNNERDYQDMGKMIYEKFSKGEEIDAVYIELCEAIKARDEEIEKANESVAQLKGFATCPECKTHIDENVVFCPKCGTKIKE